MGRRTLRVLLPTLIVAGATAGATLTILQHRRATGPGDAALALDREYFLDAGRRISALSSEVKAELESRFRWLASPEARPDPAGAPPGKAPEARKKVATRRTPNTGATTPLPAELRSAFPNSAGSGARWGMRVDAVLQAFSGKAARLAVHERVRIGEFVSAAAIRAVKVGTHLYVASFLFDPAGRLAAIQLRLDGTGGDTALAYDEAAAWLSAEYGPAPEHAEEASPSGSWARLARWKTASGLIELRGEETTLQESRVFSVDIRAGLVKPQPGSGVLLTYRPRFP
jgi:hypothetical protein